MKPKSIQALLEMLRRDREFSKLLGNLLAQWGPPGKPRMSAIFLPPRLVEKNQDTIEEVNIRTVAAIDGTRHSPAQLVDAGELFGKINYRLGHSDLARQIVGPDYDGVLAWLNRGVPMEAAARVMGMFSTMILDALVDHDELANWEAIFRNEITRRGNNAYFEYEQGPDLSGHRVNASVNWTTQTVDGSGQPTNDPWASDIIPRIRFLTRLNYDRGGIRVVLTDRQLQTLAEHPATTRRAFSGSIATGQTIDQASSVMVESDVYSVFRKLGISQDRIYVNDQRIQTRTGETRCTPEDEMAFIASTGRTEEVRFNVDNPSEVRMVENTLGFSAIGVANGMSNPGRQSAQRAFENQKDARIEMEGWQASGPIILNPDAISVIKEIDLVS
jgi:hypothetical protein